MIKSSKVGKNVLGRGLSNLLGSVSIEDVLPGGLEARSRYMDIPIDVVITTPDQPRKIFDEEKMEDLVRSIKEHGVLQPILVVHVDSSPHAPAPERTKGKTAPHSSTPLYRIIAGERRWRASKKAGLKKIPAHIVSLSETEQREVSLIENLLRDDLKPSEQATCFVQLMKDKGWSQAQLAARIGKDRTYISRMVKIMNFDEGVRQLIDEGVITPGHLRSLTKWDGTPAKLNMLARKIAKEGMSVRQTEQWMASRQNENEPSSRSKSSLEDSRKIQHVMGNEAIKITHGLKKIWPSVPVTTRFHKNGALTVQITVKDQTQLQSVLKSINNLA